MANSLINFMIRNYIPYYNNKISRKLDGKPVSVGFWLKKRERFKRLSSKGDILIPSARFLRSKGQDVPVKELKKVLLGMVIGNWTLDRFEIEVLWDKLQKIKPKIIIETGSGISTLMFAKYMQTTCPNGRVISLEQDEKEKIRVQKLLFKNNLSSFVKILYAPLNSAGHYDFNKNTLLFYLSGRKADFLMIDGPCGWEGIREYVMDDLLDYMNLGASWFADDSFRDGELNFLKRWENRKDIDVHGIYPVGKGLAEGKIF
ncbi:MAG: hypothetical protein ACRDE2_00100 [Chitinophagaceae bacterium]